MNKILETLYEQWCGTRQDTPQLNRASAAFCEPNENITRKQADTNYELLAECANAESKQAFCAGFQTAVQLLMGGMQP